MKDCFTNLDQSAKLIQLGLDICTADGYRKLKAPQFAHTIEEVSFEVMLKNKKATTKEKRVFPLLVCYAPYRTHAACC